jgi:hypothetical protein
MGNQNRHLRAEKRNGDVAPKVRSLFAQIQPELGINQRLVSGKIEKASEI